MHDAARQWVQSWLIALPTRRRIVDFGGRDVNGTMRVQVPHVPYWSIDLLEGDGVDEVADAETWQPPAEWQQKPDTVLCLEVLEHATNGAAIVRNAHSILAPWGVLLVTAAGPGREPHSGVDGNALRANEHYHPVTRFRLESWLEIFSLCACYVTPDQSDVYGIAIK